MIVGPSGTKNQHQDSVNNSNTQHRQSYFLTDEVGPSTIPTTIDGNNITKNGFQRILTKIRSGSYKEYNITFKNFAFNNQNLYMEQIRDAVVDETGHIVNTVQSLTVERCTFGSEDKQHILRQLIANNPGKVECRYFPPHMPLFFII